jgi:hypothetical protein
MWRDETGHDELVWLMRSVYGFFTIAVQVSTFHLPGGKIFAKNF